MKRALLGVLSGMLVLMVAAAACAPSQEAYPTREISLIVPSAAGSGGDLFAREIVVPLGKYLGKSVSVKNVAGGALTIGTAEAAQAKPDGYTLLFGLAGPMTTQPHLQKLPYDPLTSFEAVAGINGEIFVLLVRADAPYSTLKEMADHFGQPGKEGLLYATSGAGTINHLAMTMLSNQMKLPMTHVPFTGTAPGVMAVLGGQVDASVAEPAAAVAFVEEKRARLVTVYGDKRYDRWPDMPTTKEQGYDVVSGGWTAIFAPKGTPQPVINKLSEGFKQAMEDPAVLKAANNLGRPIWSVPGSEVSSRLKRDYDLFGQLLRQEGLAKN